MLEVNLFNSFLQVIILSKSWDMTFRKVFLKIKKFFEVATQRFFLTVDC